MGPSAHVAFEGSGAVVEIQLGNHPFKLLVNTVKSAYPRDVHEMLQRFKQILALTPALARSDIIPILLAQALSPGAKDLLRKENVGYFDSGGSLFLPAPGAYVFIDKPPPEPEGRVIRTIFTGRRAQVLHVLLQHPREWFGVTDIAAQAFVSTTTASQTLSELERLDWAEIRGQGPSKERQLTQPAETLDGWARAPQPAIRHHRYFIDVENAEVLTGRVAQAFEQAEVDYAITSEAAAQRYARFLSGISQIYCRVPAAEVARDAIQRLDPHPVTQGANLILIENNPMGELLFKQRVDDIWLASPIHVYLDLLRGKGRSKEAAEHLRHEKMGF